MLWGEDLCILGNEESKERVQIFPQLDRYGFLLLFFVQFVLLKADQLEYFLQNETILLQAVWDQCQTVSHYFTLFFVVLLDQPTSELGLWAPQFINGHILLVLEKREVKSGLPLVFELIQEIHVSNQSLLKFGVLFYEFSL